MLVRKAILFFISFSFLKNFPHFFRNNGITIHTQAQYRDTWAKSFHQGMMYPVGDAAHHLILGHDQVLSDNLLLLLVFALYLPTTTTSAASFFLTWALLMNLKFEASPFLKRESTFHFSPSPTASGFASQRYVWVSKELGIFFLFYYFQKTHYNVATSVAYEIASIGELIEKGKRLEVTKDLLLLKGTKKFGKLILSMYLMSEIIYLK